MCTSLSRIVLFQETPLGRSFETQTRVFMHNHGNSLISEKKNPVTFGAEVRKMLEGMKGHARDEKGAIIAKQFFQVCARKDVVEYILSYHDNSIFKNDILKILGRVVDAKDGSMRKELYTQNTSLIDSLIETYSLPAMEYVD